MQYEDKTYCLLGQVSVMDTWAVKIETAYKFDRSSGLLCTMDNCLRSLHGGIQYFLQYNLVAR